MQPGISIRTVVVGTDTHVIALAGALDRAAVPAVEAALARGIGCRQIVDLLDVSYIDEAGASLLERPAIVVVADRPALRRLVDAGGRQPRAYATLTDAVAAVAVA